MNLVTPSLRRPFTVVVIVLAVVVAAVMALRRMPRDIFPTLRSGSDRGTRSILPRN